MYFNVRVSAAKSGLWGFKMMRQRSVSLAGRQWEAVESEASRCGIGISEYLRRLLDHALEVRRQVVMEAEASQWKSP
jgi:hypothetical protein